MSERMIDRIAKAMGVEVEDLPTHTVLQVQRDYLARHWDELKPIMLKLMDELDNEAIIKQRLREWVSGAGRE